MPPQLLHNPSGTTAHHRPSHLSSCLSHASPSSSRAKGLQWVEEILAPQPPLQTRCPPFPFKIPVHSQHRRLASLPTAWTIAAQVLPESPSSSLGHLSVSFSVLTAHRSAHSPPASAWWLPQFQLRLPPPTWPFRARLTASAWLLARLVSAPSPRVPWLPTDLL